MLQHKEGINLFTHAIAHENYMVYNINLILYTLLSCVSVFTFLLNIKVVEGSGSEGASKYVGEGVTYGVFLETLSHFYMCMCLLMHHISRHTQLLTSSRCNIVEWCH